MAKAVTALTLGKNYMQDQALRWGSLTRPEQSHRDGDASKTGAWHAPRRYPPPSRNYKADSTHKNAQNPTPGVLSRGTGEGDPDNRFHVGIVGGGPGGLMTAYHVQKYANRPVRLTVIEASDRLGGEGHDAASGQLSAATYEAAPRSTTTPTSTTTR